METLQQLIVPDHPTKKKKLVKLVGPPKYSEEEVIILLDIGEQKEPIGVHDRAGIAKKIINQICKCTL